MSLVNKSLERYQKSNQGLSGNTIGELINDKFLLRAALIIGAVPALTPITQIKAQCVSSTLLNNVMVPDQNDNGLFIDLDGGGPDFEFVERGGNEGTLYIEGIGGAQVLGVYFASFPNTVVPNNYGYNAVIDAPTGGNRLRDNGFLFYSNGLGPWGVGTTSGYIGIAKGGMFGFIEVEITAVLEGANTSNVYDFFVTVTNGGFDVGVPGNVLAGNCGTLPVELVSFTAQVLEQEVVLAWSTLSEINNSGFVVERSHDGLNFSRIGFVEGAGNTSKEIKYSFTDSDLKESIYYYRLKQLDYNGRFSYSEIIEVDIPDNKSVIGEVYPNPTSIGEVSFSFISEKRDLLSIQIYNSSGQVQKGFSNPINKGSNQINLDVSDLSTGLYIAKINNGSDTNFRKFVVE